MLTNKLSIVQVIDKNKLRWFGLVVRREEESMLRVVMQLNMKGNIPRGKTTWLDHIDRHQKGKYNLWKKSSERNVSRIDTIGGHRFFDQLTGILEKILILLSCRLWFSARCSDARVHYITTRMGREQAYWNQRQAAGSWTGGFIYATGSPPPRKSIVAYITPIHQPCIVVLSCQPRPWIY